MAYKATGGRYAKPGEGESAVVKAIRSPPEAELQRLQLESCKLTARLFEIGFHPASRRMMALLGVELGPPRTPLSPLSDDQLQKLDEALEELDFDQWRR